jgi:uncharacterized protein with PQ loop repeat
LAIDINGVSIDEWEVLNWVASAGFSGALMPQLVRTLRRRSADDISRVFATLILLSSVCMLAYMAHLGNWVFASAQAANLVVWGIVLYYRVKPGKPKAT